MTGISQTTLVKWAVEKYLQNYEGLPEDLKIRAVRLKLEDLKQQVKDIKFIEHQMWEASKYLTIHRARYKEKGSKRDKRIVELEKKILEIEKELNEVLE